MINSIEKTAIGVRATQSRFSLLELYLLSIMRTERATAIAKGEGFEIDDLAILRTLVQQKLDRPGPKWRASEFAQLAAERSLKKKSNDTCVDPGYSKYTEYSFNIWPDHVLLVFETDDDFIFDMHFKSTNKVTFEKYDRDEIVWRATAQDLSEVSLRACRWDGFDDCTQHRFLIQTAQGPRAFEGHFVFDLAQSWNEMLLPSASDLDKEFRSLSDLK